MQRFISFITAWMIAAACFVPHTFAQTAGPQNSSDVVHLYQEWQQVTDLEAKIALGEQLLTLERDLKGWPLEDTRDSVKAQILFLTGSAYAVRPRGVRANNVEKAIIHLEAVLAIWTREDNPQNWARAHNNIGIAYWGRIRGERASNQDKAISHFETALLIFSRASAPQEWAQLQNNLATIYFSRDRGSRDINMETAIIHFEASLTVFTRETQPHFWAQVQNNLGNLYRQRISGVRAGNREKAIASLEGALDVFTKENSPREWATAKTSLASAFLNRIHGERADNQEKAISHLEAALDVFTRDGYPQQWAKVQSIAGDAYADRVLGERHDNRVKAIAAYQAALTVFTPGAFPRDHLLTGQSLGRTLLEAGEWHKAGIIHASAREAFLLLFGQGLDETEARTVIASAGSLFAEAAFGALQRGETEAAFELANEGRARLMTAALRLQRLNLPGEKGRRFDDLRIAIRAGQQALESAQTLERIATIDRLAAMRKELLHLIDSGDTGGKSEGLSALTEARAIASSGAAIAVPVVTKFGGSILLLTKGKSGTDIDVINLPELTTNQLSVMLAGPDDGVTGGWLKAYFINYLSKPEQDQRWAEWLAAIDGLGPELWRLIGARLDSALKERGIAPGTRLIWLPSGWLGILPLGLAQDPVSKRRLADDYELVYAPSVQSLSAASRVPDPARPASLAAIINPTGDLPGTESEGGAVASHFADSARAVLHGETATPEAVLTALKGKTYWHFASHGTFSWTDPRQSALVMHQGARLSVERLLETDGLGAPDLVVLSACETGLSEIRYNPDEFIGLPGTFMALGAKGVLGTLWPVQDAATVFLMAKFYELHMGGGLSPPAALRQAQSWLREASADDLKTYARYATSRGRFEARHLAGIEEALSRDGLVNSRNPGTAQSNEPPAALAPGERAAQAPGPQVRPYAHPYFWAGFIHTGL